MNTARLNSHDMHRHSVVIIDILLTFSYYYFNYFWHVAMLQKFAGPLVGARFFVGPLFGRTR